MFTHLRDPLLKIRKWRDFIGFYSFFLRTVEPPKNNHSSVFCHWHDDNFWRRVHKTYVSLIFMAHWFEDKLGGDTYWTAQSKARVDNLTDRSKNFKIALFSIHWKGLIAIITITQIYILVYYPIFQQKVKSILEKS